MKRAHSWLARLLFGPILRDLERLQKGQERIMATLTDFQTAFDELNTATNDIAAEIQDLVDQIGAGGMSAVDEDAALATLRDAVTALQAVAATPPA